MPRKSIGETAMTDAERQARYRAARAAGAPVIRTRRALDHRGRARRWTDNVAGLVEAQAEYAAWLDSLPDNLRTARPPKHCRRSAIWTSPNSRRSSRRAASAGTDRARATQARLHRWVHRNPRAPLRQPLDGHSASRGSPYGLPAQANAEGSLLDADGGSILQRRHSAARRAGRPLLPRLPRSLSIIAKYRTPSIGGTLALAAAHQRANLRQSDALASRVAGAFSASA